MHTKYSLHKINKCAKSILNEKYQYFSYTKLLDDKEFLTLNILK